MLDLHSVAQQLAGLLEERAYRIVFAESCTAGLASATLASISGISKWHCGSAVTYREQTKQAWLGVESEMLERCGAVSREVTVAMARGVLQRTAEADIAVAVTGHLGPHAPSELDGVVYTAVICRTDKFSPAGSERCQTLTAHARDTRQSEAAGLLLRHACEVLEAQG